MYNVGMTVDSLVEAAKKLPAADRIRLVEEVWDSVAAEDEASVELSAEQSGELDRRLDRIEREGLKGASWEEVKRDLLDRARR
jgi:putative addiction module component (TIGR02574 family)